MGKAARSAAGGAQGPSAQFDPKGLEGFPASRYDRPSWLQNKIAPDPYKHLAQNTDGSNRVNHDRIEGAIGIQSSAIPWDYRHYTGDLNTHRRAEPLIYTPLVIAKNEVGTSALDLSSIASKRYAQQRQSSNAQYAPLLSAMTDYAPTDPASTDSWLPRPPEIKQKKSWEKHFLDLYAPTPPPLLSPRVPQPPRGKKAPGASFLEVASAPPLPAVLRHGSRIQPLITTLMNSDGPVPFRSAEQEAQQYRAAMQVDPLQPAAPVFFEDASFLRPAASGEHELELAHVQEGLQAPAPPQRGNTFAWH